MPSEHLNWFPFYPRDWLTDPKVMSMDVTQRGAYIHLLAIQWQEGYLPGDEAECALYLGAAHLSPLLLSCFPLGSDGFRRNPKLEKVRTEQRNKYEKVSKRNSENAKKRWESHRSATAQPPLTAGKPETSDSDSVSIKGTGKGEGSTSKAKARERYSEDFDVFWDSYPRKMGKRTAYAVWKRLSDEQKGEAIADLVALDRAGRDPDWIRDGGRYIPHPTTYLNREGFSDEWRGKNK